MLTLAAAAFMAGLGSCVGPCAASRYVALAALVASANRRDRWVRVACFIAGLLLCYGVLAVTASVIGALVTLSPFVYLALALCFLAMGLRTLTGPQRCERRRPGAATPGSALLAGGALGLVFSPCCAPVIGVMATVAAASGSFSASLLAVFAFTVGHISPLAAAGVGLKISDRFLLSHTFDAAMGTVGAGLSLALALYYGLLA